MLFFFDLKGSVEVISLPPGRGQVCGEAAEEVAAQNPEARPALLQG